MRRVVRFSPVRLAVLVLTLFATVLAAGASAAAPVTIGQTSAAADYLCGEGFGPGIAEYDLETAEVASGTGFVVPAGIWDITSWSTYAGSDGGLMSMMVFRPATGTDNYTVVAASPVEALTSSVLNTYSASVPVRGGDLLGFWADKDASCLTHTRSAGRSQPVEPGCAADRRQHGQCTPVSRVPAEHLCHARSRSGKADCMKGGWQSYGVFKNQGDCVSFVATGGKNLAAGG